MARDKLKPSRAIEGGCPLPHAAHDEINTVVFDVISGEQTFPPKLQRNIRRVIVVSDLREVIMSPSRMAQSLLKLSGMRDYASLDYVPRCAGIEVD